MRRSLSDHLDCFETFRCCVGKTKTTGNLLQAASPLKGSVGIWFASLARDEGLRDDASGSSLSVQILSNAEFALV